MLFNSYVFILGFLPIALMGFYFIGKRFKHRYAIYWLIMMSFIFYSWWNYKFILLILLSVSYNYVIGGYITRNNKKHDLAQKYLIAGIIFNLALLGFFKYLNFFVENINYLFNTDTHIINIILPIGISFYTFTQIAYLVDIYKEKITTNYKLSTYVLFVVYFPHLIAGPILNHKEMMPQFDNLNIVKFNVKNFTMGVSVFAMALFKKVVIADYFSGLASPLFAASADGYSLTFFESWIAAISYTFQIYFDFSAYSEMAVGLSLMLNILIPANFFCPYKSKSIEQFWHRWHISLSRFLRDYLYIPLGGNRKGKIRQRLNLLITMLLGGLWHGAAWNFLIWGGMHGILLIINHSFKSFGKFRLSFIKWAVTFFVIINTWVIFRADSLKSALIIYSGMYDFSNIGVPAQLRGIPFIASLPCVNFNGMFQNIAISDYTIFIFMVFISVLILFCLPNIYQIFNDEEIALITYKDNIRQLAKTTRIKWQTSIIWAVLIGFLFAVAFLSIGKASEFLYFQF